MRTQTTPVGQFIFDEIGDTDEAYDYVCDILPLIGEVVIWFNTLESDLDHILCNFISDRSDQKGLLVVANMMYATKLDLFERFATEFLRASANETDSFSKLLSDMRECGTLRNKVVHANWMYTNSEGYTQVKIKVGKRGLEHELTQFTAESLQLIIQKVQSTREQLDYLNIEFFT